MGPSENPTCHRRKQVAARRRPLPRRCLLKGCEQHFRRRHAQQRYCCTSCRQAARKWSRCKSQARYRATVAGKEKRNSQSRRYRERVRNREQAKKDAVPEPREGNHQQLFSMPAATGLAATRHSFGSRARRCSGSARTRAGAPWNVCGSGSGAGGDCAGGQWP